MESGNGEPTTVASTPTESTEQTGKTHGMHERIGMNRHVAVMAASMPSTFMSSEDLASDPSQTKAGSMPYCAATCQALHRQEEARPYATAPVTMTSQFKHVSQFNFHRSTLSNITATLRCARSWDLELAGQELEMVDL